jgi:imidazolonepropionase-like amidohydrolase
VTAHVFGLGELDKALDCGVDELAHMLMSPEEIPDETIRRMVAAGVRVVPTLRIHRGKVKRKAIANLARFVEAGGEVLYGTDLGNASPFVTHAGREEVARMKRAGMNSDSILRSATVLAAAALGLEDRGIIAPGHRADLVTTSGHPGDAVGQESLVDFVMRNGKVARRSSSSAGDGYDLDVSYSGGSGGWS